MGYMEMVEETLDASYPCIESTWFDSSKVWKLVGRLGWSLEIQTSMQKMGIYAL